MGSYDVALMHKDDEGKVHVTKYEKRRMAPGRARRSAACGASSFAGGPRCGGRRCRCGRRDRYVMGGMSRSDAKELGEQLDEGQELRWS